MTTEIVAFVKSLVSPQPAANEAPRKAVTQTINRGAHATGVRTASTLEAIDAAVTDEQASLKGAETYAVLRSRFYLALAFTLPVALLLLASWHLTVFALGIIPDETVRDAAALAMVAGTVIAIHMVLHAVTRAGWLVLVLSLLAAAALTEAHYVLAKARAEVIAESVAQAVAPLLEAETAIPEAESDPSTLAQTIAPLLKTLLPLMAVGLELMAGLGLHFILQALLDPPLLAYRRIARLRRRAAREKARADYMRVLGEHAEEEARATIEFAHRARTFATKDALLAMVLAITVLLIAATQAFSAPADGGGCSAESSRVALLIDLSQSRTPADVNADVAAVTRVLSEAMPCSHYVVLGIGADGWAAPLVLLDVKVTTRGGFMQQGLRSARRRIVAGWTTTSRTLVPAHPGSDLIGSVMYATELLGLGPGKPGIIVSLSDGRQTRGVNLENGTSAPAEMARKARELGLVPSLKGSRAFFLGASTAGKTPAAWWSLRSFWQEWSNLAGLELGAFAVGRDVCGVTRLCTTGAPVALPAPASATATRGTHSSPPAPASVAAPAAVPHADGGSRDANAETLAGTIGASAAWGSGWLDLDATTDLKRGDRLRLAIDGARRVVVRLIGAHDDPNLPVGIEGGVLDVGPDGTLEITLKRDHPATRHISVHGGPGRLWNLYRMPGGNRPATLLAVERWRAR